MTAPPPPGLYHVVNDWGLKIVCRFDGSLWHCQSNDKPFTHADMLRLTQRIGEPITERQVARLAEAAEFLLRRCRVAELPDPIDAIMNDLRPFLDLE